MIIVTDILREPFDEGAKIATINLVRYIKNTTGSFVVSVNAASSLTLVDASFKLNKLLFNLHFYKTIREQKHTGILYIPEASATLFSFIRAWLLYLFTGKNVFLLALQPRIYSPITKYVVKAIQPKLIISQSKTTADYLAELGVKNAILPLGVDDRKYREFDSDEKKRLKEEFQVDAGKTVLLHVGHIQRSRNLGWLIDVKKDNPDLEIIIVGSTYNQDDEELYKSLINSGIKVFRDYIPNMENIYNLADYYIFPVTRNDGAIETPLSVLEAMACNLPIITTRFGSLPDTFASSDDFHYVDSAREITECIRQPHPFRCNNRKRTQSFTWEGVARKLVAIVEQ